MTTITDPARELAEIAARLTVQNVSAGESFLAEQFGVERWSTDFFKIITCILDRADMVAAIISNSDMDADHQLNAKMDLEQFKAGFTGGNLAQTWDQGGLRNMRDHGRPIQYLSPIVRREVSYPKLTDEEVAEFVEVIDRYVEELKVSGSGPEFVTRAIIDGLTAFKFQLQRIGWMGAGYTLAAFREVIIAYDAAQQYAGESNPDANAFLKGLYTIITNFKKKVDEAKSWTDAAEAGWKFYQIGSAVATPLLLTGTLQLPNLK